MKASEINRNRAKDFEIEDLNLKVLQQQLEKSPTSAGNNNSIEGGGGGDKTSLSSGGGGLTFKPILTDSTNQSTEHTAIKHHAASQIIADPSKKLLSGGPPTLSDEGEEAKVKPKNVPGKVLGKEKIEESRKRAKSGCSMNQKSPAFGKNGASESSEEVDEDDDFFEITRDSQKKNALKHHQESRWSKTRDLQKTYFEKAKAFIAPDPSEIPPPPF